MKEKEGGRVEEQKEKCDTAYKKSSAESNPSQSSGLDNPWFNSMLQVQVPPEKLFRSFALLVHTTHTELVQVTHWLHPHKNCIEPSLFEPVS